MLASEQAFQILCQNVLTEESELNDKNNNWVKHSIYVGIGSERIAEKLHLNSDYAKAIGLIHDVGRKISHPNHVIEGYKIMLNEGYPDAAKICITHSFINNDITITAGGGPSTQEKYTYINNLLKQYDLTLYDNIVQICDLFCSENGFTTIEKRILDITKRKGSYDNSLRHYEETIKLKNHLEELMHTSLYSLFPEIPSIDISNNEKDKQELLEMINNPTKVYSYK